MDDDRPKSQIPAEGPLSPLAIRAAPECRRSPRIGSVWAGGALVGGLTFIVFLPSLQLGFINWDDVVNFLRNPFYRGLGWPNLQWMFTSFRLGHYIPITWMTLGLDYVLWGMNPRGYHLTSLVLHAVNAVLFYLLVYRLLTFGFALWPSRPLGSREGETSFGQIDSSGVSLPLGAAVAALLFAVHPLRVESVTWISERRDLVAGLFSLLTVHAYLTAYRQGTPARLRAGWYAVAIGLFGLALLSKSIVVALPLALLALDLYPLRRITPGGDGSRRRLVQLVVEKIPFLLLSAALTAAMVHAGLEARVMTPLDVLGMKERLAIASYSLVFYLWKTAVPLSLSPLYELHFPVAVLSPRYTASIGVVAVITAGTIMARGRWPAGLTAWLVYVALLLPVIGIVHNGNQIAADRYTYLACLPWPLLVGAAMVRGSDAARRGAITRRLAGLMIALAATVVLALAGLTLLQIR